MFRLSFPPDHCHLPLATSGSMPRVNNAAAAATNTNNNDNKQTNLKKNK